MTRELTLPPNAGFVYGSVAAKDQLGNPSLVDAIRQRFREYLRCLDPDIPDTIKSFLKLRILEECPLPAEPEARKETPISGDRIEAVSLERDHAAEATILAQSGCLSTTRRALTLWHEAQVAACGESSRPAPRQAVKLLALVRRRNDSS